MAEVAESVTATWRDSLGSVALVGVTDWADSMCELGRKLVGVPLSFAMLIVL